MRGLRCVDDASCGERRRCADGGLCVPARCDTDGFSCPARTTCAATDPASDINGCPHEACAADADCRVGACIKGRCFDAPGACFQTSCV